MAINQWPEDQRPRERLIKNGAHVLSNPELLAIFLRTGVKGKSAIDLGRDVVNHFGSIGRIFSANLSHFAEIHGLGPAKFAQLQAVLELARRALAEELAQGITLNAPQQVREYLQLRLSTKTYEAFTVLFLDVQNRLVYAEEIFRGTLTQSGVFPREIVKTALAHNAAGVILAHNHPTGTVTPSTADYALTKVLKEALALVDVDVLDHFIIAGNEIYSFAEHAEI